MTKQTIGLLSAFALALGLAAPADAAQVVDITYDLSDTTILTAVSSDCATAPEFSNCTQVDLLGGSMKISYASNSKSSMPVVHGPATLQSLAFSANVELGHQDGETFYAYTTAHLNVNLVSPVAGSLLSGGTLTFGSAQIRATGTRHCLGGPLVTGLCVAVFGTITSIPVPLGPFTTTGALSFAAPAGPYGGAQSTTHTVSGTIPVRAPSKFVENNPGYISFGVFASGANLLGREVLREAEGHDPKVIPEPGTLLLLGAGTAGLALVGRATRRSR